MSSLAEIPVPAAVMANLRGYPHLAGIADEWRRSLPERAAQLCSDWQLELTGERLTGGFWSVLLGAHDERDDEVVLKLCADDVRLDAEAAALSAWANAPAVDLLAQTSGALLLARVRPGTELEHLGPVRLSRLLAELRCLADNDALIDWRGRVQNTVDRIPELAAAAGAPELAVDVQALGERVMEVGAELPVVVLHGDIHPANLLDQGGEAIVIDPYGIAGPWELDVANCAVNNEWRGLNVRERVLALAELTGADPDFTLTYARLYALLDGCYHIANRTEHVAHAAALLSFVAEH